MNISQNAAPGGAATPPDRTSTPAAAYTPRAVLQQAADARRQAIAGAVSTALSSDRLKPDDTAKSLARAQLQALIERVRILKKLYAGNPREMARALAQVFKELKAALKAYQQAAGDELGMAGDLATGAAAEAPAQGQSTATTEASPAAPSEPSSDSQTPAAPAPEAAASYAAVTQGMREAIGRDEQSFLGDVRSFAQALSDTLAGARIQAKGARPDKATDRAFEDADKQFASLQHALDDADRDLRNAVPTLGLHLSIAA